MQSRYGAIASHPESVQDLLKLGQMIQDGILTMYRHSKEAE
jgi:hypothetical protein